MPIKPENRKRYPRDWKAIRGRIMERAQNRCECQGECGDTHPGPDVWRCHAEHGALIIRDPDRPALYEVHTPCGGCAGGDPDCARAIRVVLTCAHLDHTPERNDPSNLLALCQRCHLRYDATHHASNARATRRSRKAVGDLPGLDDSTKEAACPPSK